MTRLEPVLVSPLAGSSGEVKGRGEGEEESHSSSHSFFFPRENARVSEPCGVVELFDTTFKLQVEAGILAIIRFLKS